MFKKLLNWTKEFFESSTPKAALAVIDGKLSVKNYNKAFVNDVRDKMGDVTNDKTDEEVIELYVGHEVAEKEEPRLEVLHLGMHADGRVKMSLDWNNAFIKQCKRAGFDAESEETIVNMYLNSLVGKRDEDSVDPESTEEIFEQIDDETKRELEEARETLGLKDKAKPRRRSYRSNSKRVVIK